jgi:hypothetical protein
MYFDVVKSEDKWQCNKSVTHVPKNVFEFVLNASCISVHRVLLKQEKIHESSLNKTTARY